MAEFPALPLWTDAYLGDTTHLSTFEHGAYMLLLIVSWRSPGCCLPDDDAMLSRYTRMTRDKWRKVRPIMEPFFRIGGGFWTQARLQDELQHLQSRRKQQSEAGHASAVAKSLKRKNRGSTPVRSTLQRNVNDGSTPIPIPISSKKELPNGSSKKAARTLPKSWSPRPFEKGKCKAIIDGWSGDRFNHEVEAFTAHHGSRANAMVDWQQAWQTWVLNADKFEKQRSKANGAGRDESRNRTTDAAIAAFGDPSTWTDDKPL